VLGPNYVGVPERDERGRPDRLSLLGWPALEFAVESIALGDQRGAAFRIRRDFGIGLVED